MTKPVLGWFYPLPTELAASVKAKPGGEPPAPPSAAEATHPGYRPLTQVQGEIHAALSYRPLNPFQVLMLGVYHQAYVDGLPGLSVDEMASRLKAKSDVDPKRAADFVRGGIRSFGKRLRQTLTVVPVVYGKDSMGDGVADETPLLAMFTVTLGSMGERRQALTDDGAVAVAAALGLVNQHVGEGADDTVVALGMSKHSADMLNRVAATKGVSLDKAIQWMTAQAGAG